MYKLIFLFFSSFVFSQNKTIAVVSSFDNSSIENVLVYSENNFLGSTDKNGQIIIKVRFQNLKLVKENYDDIKLTFNDLEELNWFVKLKPITFIELNDVVVKSPHETVPTILAKIKESRVKQNSYKFKYYQSNVKFIFDSQDIFLFNNIIYPSNGLKVNDKNKIIYSGFRVNSNILKHDVEYFKVDQKTLQIPTVSTVYCSLGSHEISPIFDSRLYDYLLEESEDTYILKFFPKKKNPTLLYKGYFIVDKLDYGILELTMVLAESKKNIWWTNSYDMTEKYEYQIKEDTFKFKFSKVEDHYFLENSSRVLVGIQTKGNHVGAKLKCNFYNEETLDQSGLIFKDYDWTTQKFK